ncbi:MAG: excinuclease ABC subunit A [Thiotrichales bacterium]|nr:MAG: excinuclease ABC subunit A [Thiotrichales bacterium]
MEKHISLRGARTHNLKNIDLDLPHNKLIVITGLSGSGKSSLAFDTLYAEGQRRYVESLSSYARQFLSIMEKPDVDHISGLAPAIAIQQKSVSHNPRSTVGTVTEIYDYLRLLFARAGTPFCPEHKVKLECQTTGQMVDQIITLPQGSKIRLLAPVVRNRKGEYKELLQNLHKQGFLRAVVDGKTYELADHAKIVLEKNQKHDIAVVVDRLKIKPDMQQRLSESLATALDLTGGIASVGFMDDTKTPEIMFSANHSCMECGYSLSKLEPQLFSFNNPTGACEICKGLGVESFFDPEKIVINAALSLAQGAILNWNKNHKFYYQRLLDVAAHYDFPMTTPFSQLSEQARDVILYGSKDEVIEFSHTSYPKEFEGVIPNMRRRYYESESELSKEHLYKYMSDRLCLGCHGSRLCEKARNVKVGEHTLPEFVSLLLNDALHRIENLNLPSQKQKIAEQIVNEIKRRLQFLLNVGLDYLTLERRAETLSGGEAQRIRLASQIGSGLVGVMYVLDEPSIGLHQRDNDRLLKTLRNLRDLGNTVIVVEHDQETIEQADYVIDIGPGAGVHGGEVVAKGLPKDIIAETKSLTGKYLSGELSIPVPSKILKPQPEKVLKIIGAHGNNLNDISVEIPLGLLVCITGVSGSGKSTLVNETIYPLAAHHLNKANLPRDMKYKEIQGLEHLDKVVAIDQSPIGRTPRSNPATYIGVFTAVRELFAKILESCARGYSPGRFSFNVKGGRCEACQGDGVIKVIMHFLPDVFIKCEVCDGKRYNRETLDIRYRDKNINDVLSMTVEDACEFFKNIPTIAHKLKTIDSVGLGYIQLGQSAVTLSGGEAQRVKLAKELSKRATGKTLYILDEPTTGLHFHDIKQLLQVLDELKKTGNTILIIEHNLDVIKTADWVIDLGPEGGRNGGKIVTTGTPQNVAKCATSHTGKFLAKLLDKVSTAC